MDYFPLTLFVYYFLKSVYIFAHWRSYLNIHILIYSHSKSCYFCMPGRWLTTGQRGHILAFSARRPRSLHHTWPHRWSCSCMAHQRGCSWCCLRRCGFGLNLDTPGLRWAGINVWSTSLDKLTDKTTTWNTSTQWNRVVPVATGLAKQSRYALQTKAKFTVEITGRVETIWSMRMETLLETLSWFQQRLACNCWRKIHFSFEIWLRLVHIYI